MANVFTLTDGTTTVSINAGSYTVTEYNAGTAETGADRLTESLDIVVTGSTATATATNVRALESMVETVRRRARTQAGARVWFTVQWDGMSDNWRAEVFDAQIDPVKAPGQLWRKAVSVTLALTRGPLEGDWTQLTLTNGNGTDNTSGLKVFNCSDGTGTAPNKRHFYADIDSSEVTGVLPAPVKLEMVNSNGASRGWGEWWLSANSFNGPATFTTIIEGESRVSGYGTVTANADASGGNYNAQTVSGTTTTHFDISAAQAQLCGGYPFRLLARFSAAVPNAFVTPCIYDSTGTVKLGAGDEIELQSSMARLVELGVLSIPPGDAATTFGAVRLVLEWRSSSSQNIALDYIHLAPFYACRQMIQRGMNVLSTETVVLDESETRAYFTESGAQHAVFVLRGRPLTVQPGRANRLYFQVTRLTGAHDVTDVLTVKAWFRPRRWSL